MNIFAKWGIVTVAAAIVAYLVGEVAGSGVATISVFFSLLMVGWAMIYKPWQ